MLCNTVMNAYMKYKIRTSVLYCRIKAGIQKKIGKYSDISQDNQSQRKKTFYQNKELWPVYLIPGVSVESESIMMW